MTRARVKPRVDRARYPHDYTGPTTNWGLRSGEACRIIGGAAGGGKRIKTTDGKTWIVGAHQIARWSR